MRLELCPSCKQELVQQHHNAKWCAVCAAERRKKPPSSLTPAQVRKALKLRGTMLKDDVAKAVGVSRAAITRLGRERGVSFSAMPYATNPKLVARVIAHYDKHGRIATQKRFPDVSVRAIVEHYGRGRQPRQVRWTDEQIVAAARMAGIVSMERQAEIFGRPGAHKGSIRSLWIKRLKVAGGGIHGMSAHTARHLLRPGFPVVTTQFWNTRRGSSEFSRQIVLWCDMGPWLRRGTPPFVREGIKAMTNFQRWLFKTDNPRKAILAMLRKERRANA